VKERTYKTKAPRFEGLLKIQMTLKNPYGISPSSWLSAKRYNDVCDVQTGILLPDNRTEWASLRHKFFVILIRFNFELMIFLLGSRYNNIRK